MSMDGDIGRQAYRPGARHGPQPNRDHSTLHPRLVGIGDVDTRPLRVETHWQACFTPVLD